jgi:DNA-binding NarL/FixJ family response regulator
MLSTNYITILNLSDVVPRIQGLGRQLQEVSFTEQIYNSTGLYMPFLIPETQCALNKKNCFRCGSEFATSHSDRVCVNCRKPRVSPQENKELSFRERQVINLVSQGKANKEIAFELLLTEGTIKEYLNRIFRKVEVKNRTELAIWALTRQKTAA